LIITDEMLCGRKEEETTRRDAKERVARAFYVVLTAAGIAVASMLPLLLSGIVEITGFALSTIIGVTIGVLVTRPAYGAFMEVMFGTTN
ncbi:preprotein translocase subunit SecD, partial [Candidatus Micrarchaeota archaeon CG_4_10_14_0_2_um_filter_55_9]